MADFSLDWIAETCGAARLLSEAPLSLSSVSIDTRTINPGALFIALQGERFDGHDFIAEARDRGAFAAIISQTSVAAVSRQLLETQVSALANESFTLLAVADPLLALHALAKAYRAQLRGQVICVVGSNGKTTTKNLLGRMLAPSAQTTCSQGNLNNHIGLPLSLLRARLDDAFVVLEAGINHPGELDCLGQIVKPDLALLTTVQLEHLEGLGSLERVATSEGELFAHLAPQGCALYPADEAVVLTHALRACPANVRRLTFGEAGEVTGVRLLSAVLTPEGLTHARYQIAQDEIEIQSPLLGHHHARNIAAAMTAAWYLGVSVENMRKAASELPPAPHRMHIIECERFTVIDDCYNANPGSMEAALEALTQLARLRGGRAVALLGDMRELGERSAELHQALGEALVRHPVDLVAYVGQMGKVVTDAAQSLGMSPEAFCYAPALRPALAWLKPRLKNRDLILVKASRGMKLEAALPSLGAFVNESNTPPKEV